MTRLFVYLVNDALTEYTYDASLSVLDYLLRMTSVVFEIRLGGYNDKLHILAKHVLEKVKHLEVKEDRLAVMKENVSRNYHRTY